MSIDNRFTEDEQFLLANAPYLVGTVMVFSEGSGLGTIKEMYSNSKSFIGGAKSFPDNEIITGILPNMTDFSDVREKSSALKEKSIEAFKARGVKSKEEMKTYALEELDKVAKLLKEKATPDEISEYNQWVLSIAENVAKAAKEGGFLGFGGELVSEGEKEFYAEVASILDSDTRLG
jgi:hypothetical protein